MIQFFASALLLGTLGGAAIGFSKYGRGKVRSPAVGWAVWLSIVAVLFAATYAMSVSVYASLIKQDELYWGLGLAGGAYLTGLLAMRQWLKRPDGRAE